MNKIIEKVGDISHPSFNILNTYFENLSFNFTNFPPVHNFALFKKENLENAHKDVVMDIKKSVLNRFFSQDIFEHLDILIEHLKQIYDVDIIWFMTYIPKSHLAFHVDAQSNRHLIPLNNDERFFSYESPNLIDFIDYTEKMKEHIDDIDVFNKFYLDKNPNENKITNLKAGGIYTFGETMHNFFNGSDKLRVNLVFETKQGRRVIEESKNEIIRKKLI